MLRVSVVRAMTGFEIVLLPVDAVGFISFVYLTIPHINSSMILKWAKCLVNSKTFPLQLLKAKTELVAVPVFNKKTLQFLNDTDPTLLYVQWILMFLSDIAIKNVYPILCDSKLPCKYVFQGLTRRFCKGYQGYLDFQSTLSVNTSYLLPLQIEPNNLLAPQVFP